MKKFCFSLLFTIITLASSFGQKLVYIPEAGSAPVIDGHTEASWDAVPGEAILNVYGGSIDGEADLSASWKAQWDADNLYFFFRVYDEALFNLGSGAEKFWIHDCVEIFIDLLNDKDEVETGTSETDDNHQYRFIYGLDDEPIVESPPVLNMQNVSLEFTEATTPAHGYIVEVLIPWTTLIQTHPFGTVEAGKQIGADFKVCDLDNATVPAGIWAPDGELLWNNPTTVGLKLSSNFGTIQLVGQITGDTDGPEKTSDLTAVPTGSRSADLSWTAPLDVNYGKASSYEIRYSPDSMTVVNWDAATAFVNDLEAKASGKDESLSVAGLPVGTTLFFGIKSIDAAGNNSVVSNIAKATTSDADDTPPAAVSDLQIDSINGYFVQINWTAPGNDGDVGTATTYDIRYSTATITDGNYEAASPVPGIPSPETAGSKQAVILRGLSPETSYYFAMKSADEEPNYSALSNIAQATTVAYNSKTKYPIDQFLGTNSFIDVPVDKMEAVGFIREYHPWSFTEIENDVFEYNRWNGFWDFDKFYEDLKEKNITVCADLWSSPSWLRGTPEYKPILDGEDSETPNSYREMAELMYQYAGRYGAVKVDDANLMVNAGQVKKSGLGLLEYYEDWNEQDRDWMGTDAEFQPEEYAAMASANADGHCGTMGPLYGLKQADPDAKLVMGGIYKIGTDYISRMKTWFENNRADQRWPIDVINVHHYSYTYEDNGLSPEDGDFKEKVEEVIQWRNENEPSNEVWVTEFGYDSNADSPNRVPEFAGFDQQEVQAQWNLRTFLILSSTGVDRAAHFMIRDVDPGGTEQRWADCGLTLSAAEDYVPKTSWYYVYTTKNTLKDMYFETVISESPETWVYRYVNEAGDKYVYAMWCPTSTGFEKSYRLNIPGEPTRVKMVELMDGSIEGIESPVTVSSNNATINVTERPVFVIVDYGEVDSKENWKTDELSIYPNPANEHIFFNLPPESSEQNDMHTVSIIDITGQIHYQAQMDMSSFNNRNHVDIASLEQGIYLLQVNVQHKLFSNTFIKN